MLNDLLHRIRSVYIPSDQRASDVSISIDRIDPHTNKVKVKKKEKSENQK